MYLNRAITFLGVFCSPGWSIRQKHVIGQGFNDRISRKNGAGILVEIKDGSKSPLKPKITEDIEKFGGEYMKTESVDYVIVVNRKYYFHNISHQILHKMV
jgi:hypothetical protein